MHITDCPSQVRIALSEAGRVICGQAQLAQIAESNGSIAEDAAESASQLFDWLEDRAAEERAVDRLHRIPTIVA